MRFERPLVRIASETDLLRPIASQNPIGQFAELIIVKVALPTFLGKSTYSWPPCTSSLNLNTARSKSIWLSGVLSAPRT